MVNAFRINKSKQLVGLDRDAAACVCFGVIVKQIFVKSRKKYLFIANFINI